MNLITLMCLISLLKYFRNLCSDSVWNIRNSELSDFEQLESYILIRLIPHPALENYSTNAYGTDNHEQALFENSDRYEEARQSQKKLKNVHKHKTVLKGPYTFESFTSKIGNEPNCFISSPDLNGQTLIHVAQFSFSNF